jgi:hypothetical protein
LGFLARESHCIYSCRINLILSLSGPLIKWHTWARSSPELDAHLYLPLRCKRAVNQSPKSLMFRNRSAGSRVIYKRPIDCRGQFYLQPPLHTETSSTFLRGQQIKSWEHCYLRRRLLRMRFNDAVITADAIYRPNKT